MTEVNPNEYLAGSPRYGVVWAFFYEIDVYDRNEYDQPVKRIVTGRFDVVAQTLDLARGAYDLHRPKSVYRCTGITKGTIAIDCIVSAS